MSGSIGRAAAPLALILCGCQWILPFGSRTAEPDAPAPALEAAAADRSLPADAPGPSADASGPTADVSFEVAPPALDAHGGPDGPKDKWPVGVGDQTAAGPETISVVSCLDQIAWQDPGCAPCAGCQASCTQAGKTYTVSCTTSSCGGSAVCACHVNAVQQLTQGSLTFSCGLCSSWGSTICALY